MMKETLKNCPKCGFKMTDNYCVRCGYIKGGSITNIEKYDSFIAEEELVLGNDYQKVLHNENSLKIFLMGPLYFCYRKFLIVGTLLYSLDIYIRYMVSTTDLRIFSLGLMHEMQPVIFVWLVLRLIDTIFLDVLLLKVCKLKIRVLKLIMPNKYKEFLSKTNRPSLLIVIVYFIIECLLWYYVF